MIFSGGRGIFSMDYELRIVVEKVVVSSQEVLRRVIPSKVYDVNSSKELICILGLRHSEQISL